MSSFEIKLFETYELKDLCNLFIEMRPPIAGLTNRRIYRSMCQEALKNDKLIIVIAKDDRKIVGFTITAIDWKNFWLKFLLSHPIIAIEIVTKKIIDKIRANKKQKIQIQYEKEQSKYFVSEKTKKSWDDSSPQIAKIVYTGVSENYRKKGIGTNIGNYRFNVLIERGVKRIDTNLDPKNTSVIKFNYNLGYKIYKSGNRLFASKDLLK